MHADVVVVGAGPAGCAAAVHLGRLGFRVLLLERARRPQPKTCGDSLLPDALRALDDLGVGEQVRAAGRCLTSLEVTAPGGRSVRLAVPSVTLQRQRLHALLQDEAVRCGVQLISGEAAAPLMNGERVVGVSVRSDRQPLFSIRSPLVILASGARSGTLRDFGVCLQAEPSAVGIRAYYRDLSGEFADSLHISYDRQLFPGYGWVFPLPDGVYNIGCGMFLQGAGPSQTDLNRLFDYFLSSFPPARAVAGQEDMVGVPCSGLLRTGLTGAMSSRAGLLVAGEALGTTLPFTCEGVGKALETGLLAGQVGGEALHAGDFSGAFLARYGQALEQRYRAVYQGYRRAQKWLNIPGLPDLLAWQVARKPALREAAEMMLSGTLPPASIFSLSGLAGRPARITRKRDELPA
ncbi:MAG TPA: NAD(P)/FAD-dependent oxidoreductase [Desulfuromonadales bacterium]